MAEGPRQNQLCQSGILTETRENRRSSYFLPGRKHTVFGKGRDDLNTIILQKNTSLGMKAEDNSDLIYLSEENSL